MVHITPPPPPPQREIQHSVFEGCHLLFTGCPGPGPVSPTHVSPQSGNRSSPDGGSPTLRFGSWGSHLQFVYTSILQSEVNISTLCHISVRANGIRWVSISSTHQVVMSPFVCVITRSKCRQFGQLLSDHGSAPEVLTRRRLTVSDRNGR